MPLPDMFVISPKELPDRRKAAEAHFAERGLRPTFFNGIFGTDAGLLSSKDDPAKQYSRLTPGKIALALNHRFLWEHVAMVRAPAAIIFEDDVLLPGDFAGQFMERLRLTPGGWEVVYLGITYPERLEDRRIKAERLNQYVWVHKGMNAFDGTVDGTWAYMLSLSGAEKLASMRFVLDEPVDRWLTLRALDKLKTYIWHPAIVDYRR